MIGQGEEWCVPVGLNGLALGLSGAASVLLELSPSMAAKTAAFICMLWSAVYWSAFFVDRLLRPRFLRKDLEKAQTTFGYGAFEMTYLFCWMRLMVPLIENRSVGFLGVWVGAVAQLVIMFAFLGLCVRDDVPPEPMYNPPTVNCAVTSIAGAALVSRSSASGFAAATDGLVLFSFGLAVFLMLAFVPSQCYRVLSYPSKVAPSAGIAMLQAPCSLNALTWGVMRRARGPTAVILNQTLDANLAHALFALSTLVLWITIFGVVQRRKDIARRGFGLDWAAFTFPSCSSAVAALQYTSSRDHDAAAVSSHARPGNAAFVGRVYAVALSIAVLSVVFVVVVGNFIKTANAILRNPPPKSSSWFFFSPHKKPLWRDSDDKDTHLTAASPPDDIPATVVIGD